MPKIVHQVFEQVVIWHHPKSMSIPTDHVSDEIELLLAVGIVFASEATGSINKYLQAMSLEDVIEEPEEQLECEKNKKKQTPDSQHTSPTANSTPGFSTPEELLSLQRKQAYDFLFHQNQDENVSALQKELASWKAKNKELETKLNVLIRLRDYLRITQAELLSTNLPKHTEECILQDDGALE